MFHSKVYLLRSVVPLSRQKHWQKVLLETFYQEKFHYYCFCCRYLIIDFWQIANIIDKPFSNLQIHSHNSKESFDLQINIIYFKLRNREMTTLNKNWFYYFCDWYLNKLDNTKTPIPGSAYSISSSLFLFWKI